MTVWQLLIATSPSEALNAALAEGLIDLGGTAVEEDGLRLHTWLPADPAADGDAAGRANADDRAHHIAAEAARVLSERVGGVPVHVEWSWQPDEDWSARWKEGLGPRRVGARLVVTPSWEPADVVSRPEDIVIVIDPQMAFGTAEHASTRGVLRLLEHVLLTLRTGGAGGVLDVGTGSGILAIVAARLGAHFVDAVEVDPDAVDVAIANAADNDAGRVRFEHASVDAAFLAARRGRYDVIAANVLRSVLEPLLPAFRCALGEAGVLIVGGILEDEAPGMCAVARVSGFDVTLEDREDGWWSALLTAVMNDER